jgi:peptidoglycan L-alanyl-D-glutamate endopeptidase CwlK
MPIFSSESIKILKTVHPDLVVLFSTVIKAIDCTILCGYRGEDEQNAAVAAGKSKLKWPESNHNKMPSLAVDVVPYPIDWNDKNMFYWFGGYVLGIAQSLKEKDIITHSIRWGGSWDGLGKLSTKGLIDLPHFEIIL